MSIDSHLPEVFEKIRPGGKADQVFENLPRARAAAARSTGSSASAQAVFMTRERAA